jgi:hypothetical protein
MSCERSRCSVSTAIEFRILAASRSTFDRNLSFPAPRAATGLLLPSDHPTSCIASSTRSPNLRDVLPESVGSIAGSSPEFNPCFEVTGVSIGGKKTKQQLLDFRFFFCFLKPWRLLPQCNDKALNATSQREAVMIFTQSSPKPAISSHFFHRRESRDPACYFSFIVATAWIILLLLLLVCYGS